MKFECQSCNASYMIADEKIGKRGVKVKCKRCGEVIIVRAQRADAASPEAARAPEIAATAPVDDGALPPDVTNGAALNDHDDEKAAGAFVARDELRARTDDLPADESLHEDESDSSFSNSSSDDDGAFSPGPTDDDGGDGRRDAADRLAQTSSPEGAATFGEDDDDDSAFASSGESPLVNDGDASRDAQDDSGEGAFSSRDDDDDDDAFASGGASSSPAADTGAIDQEGPTRVGAVPGWNMDGGGADTEMGSMPDMTSPSEMPRASPSEMPRASDPMLASDGQGDGSLPLPDPSAAMSDDVPAPPDGSDAFDDQIAGAFSNMFGALPDPDLSAPVPPPPSPDDDDDMRGPTRVLDLNEMDRLRAETLPTFQSDEENALDQLASGFGATATGPALHPFDATDERDAAVEKRSAPVDDSGGWHVAIDDEDVGPIRLSEVVEHIESGRAPADALMWRSGMADWMPANEIEDVRSLLRNLPMPSISSPVDDRAAFDVGAPFDDVTQASPDDPFSQVPDASDPNWRPHGLTEVYQAANLAEAAVARPMSGGMSAAPSGLDDNADDDSTGWKPGAASALASLVADEIKRIETAPSPEEESSLDPMSDNLDLGAVIGSDVVHDSSGPSFIAPAGGVLSSMPLPPVESFAPMPVTGMPYAPAVAQRSPITYVFGTLGAVLLLVIAAALVKIAFVGAPTAGVGQVAVNDVPPTAPKPDDDKPTVAAIDAKPTGDTEVGGDATGPAGEEPAADKKVDTDDKPPVEKDEPKREEKDDRSAKADEKEKEKEKDEKQKVRSSSTKREVKREERREPDPPKEKPREKEKEKEVVKVSSKSSKGKKDCDPVLDFDCEEKKSSGGSEKKATLSKSDVLGVVKKNIGKINACGKSNNFKGTIKMEWEIEKSGRTSSVRVLDSEHAGTPVGRCMINEVKRWTFPQYTGAAPPPIKFPFKL